MEPNSQSSGPDILDRLDYLIVESERIQNQNRNTRRAQSEFKKEQRQLRDDLFEDRKERDRKVLRAIEASTSKKKESTSSDMVGPTRKDFERYHKSNVEGLRSVAQILEEKSEETLHVIQKQKKPTLDKVTKQILSDQTDLSGKILNTMMDVKDLLNKQYLLQLKQAQKVVSFRQKTTRPHMFAEAKNNVSEDKNTGSGGGLFDNLFDGFGGGEKGSKGGKPGKPTARGGEPRPRPGSRIGKLLEKLKGVKLKGGRGALITAGIAATAGLGAYLYNKFSGSVSEEYESGGRGVGTISSGAGDAGGVSYGKYQLASKNGSMDKFLQSPEGQAYAANFAGLKPGTPAFNEAYKKLSQQDSEGFNQAQKAYIGRTHFVPLAEKVKADTGLDVSNRSDALKELIFSTGVQYGGKTSVVSNALKNMNTESMSDKDIISAIQDYKANTVGQYFKSSSENVQNSVANRAASEKETLLGLLDAEQAGPTVSETTPLATSPTFIEKTEPIAEYSPTTAQNALALTSYAVPGLAIADFVKDKLLSSKAAEGVEASTKGASSAIKAGTALEKGAEKAAPALAKGAIEGGAKGTLKSIGRRIPLLNAGLAAYDVYDIATDETKSTSDKAIGIAGVGGGLAGAGAGAAAGAAIGSVVPIVGTAIGGLIGGAIGYFAGSNITEKAGEAIRDNFFSDENKPKEESTQPLAATATQSDDLLKVTDTFNELNVRERTDKQEEKPKEILAKNIPLALAAPSIVGTSKPEIPTPIVSVESQQPVVNVPTTEIPAPLIQTPVSQITNITNIYNTPTGQTVSPVQTFKGTEAETVAASYVEPALAGKPFVPRNIPKVSKELATKLGKPIERLPISSSTVPVPTLTTIPVSNSQETPKTFITQNKTSELETLERERTILLMKQKSRSLTAIEKSRLNYVEKRIQLLKQGTTEIAQNVQSPDISTQQEPINNSVEVTPYVDVEATPMYSINAGGNVSVRGGRYSKREAFEQNTATPASILGGKNTNTSIADMAATGIDLYNASKSFGSGNRYRSARMQDIALNTATSVLGMSDERRGARSLERNAYSAQSMANRIENGNIRGSDIYNAQRLLNNTATTVGNILPESMKTQAQQAPVAVESSVRYEPVKQVMTIEPERESRTNVQEKQPSALGKKRLERKVPEARPSVRPTFQDFGNTVIDTGVTLLQTGLI